jgi:hypothetical protein
LKALVSRRAVVAAVALVGLHLIAAAYVQATDMPYDRNDTVGLLWWLVALWVLPLIASVVSIVSIAKHLLNRNNGGD